MKPLEKESGKLKFKKSPKFKSAAIKKKKTPLTISATTGAGKKVK